MWFGEVPCWFCSSGLVSCADGILEGIQQRLRSREEEEGKRPGELWSGEGRVQGMNE